MPSTTLILNGLSLLDNADVSASLAGLGTLHVHGGTSIFGADDIIVVEVTNASLSGELTTFSRITGITVYEHGHDYVHAVPKFTYAAASSANYGNVMTGISGVGDTYVRFTSSGLVSSDPGAPALHELLLAPGTDLSNIGSTALAIPRYTSVDYNGNGYIDLLSTEVGDGLFATENNVFAVICLAGGTLVATPGGPRPIESLARGDLVETRDAGAIPIRWIGSRRVVGRGALAPVRIRRGALGNRRDLWVSPNHRMLLTGARAEILFGEAEVLVAAKHLVNDSTIRIVPRPEIDYFHLMFDDHQIIFAEGCATESLYPGGEALKGLSDDSRREVLDLFPELETRGPPGLLSRYELNRTEARVWRLTQ